MEIGDLHVHIDSHINKEDIIKILKCKYSYFKKYQSNNFTSFLIAFVN